MKKLLILILIGLLLILSIFAIVKGINIGKIEILSINNIQEKSKELDEKIQNASKIAEKDYNQAVEEVKENAKKLAQQKQIYENMIQVGEDGEVQSATQIERYEIETLWVKLGNYATSEGTIIKMDILQGSTGTTNTYNLRFTVTGNYISIVDFISDIENDSTLGFKIEEFKMIPTGTESTLEATFVCKDITIKDINSVSNTGTNVNTKVENNSNTNTTNNANNSNTNTTNNTSTNNTSTNNTSTNNTSTNNNNTTNNSSNNTNTNNTNNTNNSTNTNTNTNSSR